MLVTKLRTFFTNFRMLPAYPRWKHGHKNSKELSAKGGDWMPFFRRSPFTCLVASILIHLRGRKT
jgi:hypothetical protein